MNIHLNDKMLYYLPAIYKLENIRHLKNKEEFFKEIKDKSKKQLLFIWNQSLKEAFQIHIVIALTLLYALQRDEKNCEDYLRLAHREVGITRGADIIRCLLFCELAKFDDALLIIKNLPILISKMPFILRIKADINFAMKEYKIAESFYLKIITDIPDKSTIYSRLGEIGLLDHQLKKAEALFLKAIEMDKKNIMAHFYLGDIYKLNGEIKKAKMEYGISAAIDLDHHLCHIAQQKLFLLCVEKKDDSDPVITNEK